jgi:prevent-host-death family protein|tara:strand:- start:752 stop:1003 length:252 start_codon:yes stop_codon:yes gene_type:complete
MMQNRIGVFETKTNLNKIISRVIEGEEFTITKRGVEVAIITPLKKNKNDLSVLFKEIADLKKRLPSNFMKIEEVKGFKEEGRK